MVKNVIHLIFLVKKKYFTDVDNEQKSKKDRLEKWFHSSLS